MRVARPLEKAQTRNEEWALDFVSDVLVSGRSIRLLNVADAYTRKCVALEVGGSVACEKREPSGNCFRVLLPLVKPCAKG